MGRDTISLSRTSGVITFGKRFINTCSDEVGIGSLTVLLAEISYENGQGYVVFSIRVGDFMKLQTYLETKPCAGFQLIWSRHILFGQHHLRPLKLSSSLEALIVFFIASIMYARGCQS